VSSCKRFRLTFDFNLSFYDIKMYKEKVVDHKVIEIKFNKSYISNVSKLTAHFPFRLNKSSKYVVGVNELTSLPSIF
jgi:hypothetical protein